MADGKNIELKIAVTGGDRAAAEITKVQEAARSASTGFGGQLDGTTPRNEAAEKRIEQIEDEGKALEELGKIADQEVKEEIRGMKEKEEAAEKYARSLEEMEAPNRARRIKEIALATGAIGIAAGAAAKTFGQVQDAMESIDTNQLRAVDSAMADNIESAKTWAQALADPIGALLKLTTGETVQSAFAGLNDQLARNAEVTSDAIDRIIDKGVKQSDEIKKLTDAIVAANAILDAQDKADSAERDNADAAAVRGGASPEDVAAKRAQDDAQKEIERINRGLDPKAAEVQAAFDNLQNRKGNAETLGRTEGAKPEDQEGARKKVVDAQKEFDDRKREFENAKLIAEQERRAVRAGTTGKVEEAEAGKAARIKEEQAKREEAAFEARKNFQSYQDYRSEEADAGARKQGQAKDRNDREAGRIGKKAAGLIPKGVSDRFKGAVEDASAALQDGAQGSELEDMAAAVRAMAGALKDADVMKRAELKKLHGEIETLRQQIRNK